MLIFVVTAFLACSDINILQQTVSFPQHEWSSKQKDTFKFKITDSTARYNIFVIFRHEDAYHYKNIWLNVTTKAPRGIDTTQKLSLQLATDANGWLGSGMDDVFEHSIAIVAEPIKLKAGEYTFVLQQIMREDPLQYVLNAGIRVEKIVP